MPRGKRIQIENGWYHVFNRGIGRKTIAFNEYHFAVFLDLLKRLYGLYQIETHAYCMMKNHYHILIRTRNANISEGMWYFGTHFSKMINQDINSDGPLFRSRFRSILIQDDRYFLQVGRYIHLNPVDAQLTDFPEQYPWSSYRHYLDTQDLDLDCLQTKETLSKFNSIDEYQNFIELGNSDGISRFYKRKNIPTIISLNSI